MAVLYNMFVYNHSKGCCKRERDFVEEYIFQEGFMADNDFAAFKKMIDILKAVEMKMHFPKKYDVKLRNTQTWIVFYKKTFKYDLNMKRYRPYRTRLGKIKSNCCCS